MDNSWTLTLVGWLGTYLLHSTVLLGVTWLILRRWRRLADNGREILWRVALFGGFLTATLQLQLGVGPDLGHLELSVPTSVTATDPTPVDAPRLSTPDPQPELAPGGLAAGGNHSWLRMLLWLWAGGMLAAALRHGGRRLRLQGMLADRAAVPVGPLRLCFGELTRRAGLRPSTRFTTSMRTRCPMAFGILQPEVCLPARMAAEMDFDQQGCVLAHELAHLRASDPLWLLLEAVVSWVGFLQPLNRLACRRLRELAEFRCDAWAVRQGGAQVHMAKALMTVAENYLAAGEPVPIHAGVNAMAMRGSALSRRVERIFANPSDGSRPPGRGVLLLGSVVLGLAAVALAVPGVSLTAARHESTEQLETWQHTAPRLKRLRFLEAELRDLQSDLDGIRDTLQGSLRHPEVRSILVKLQHRIRELQAEQQVLWREAIDAVRSKQHTNRTTRPVTRVAHHSRSRR